MAKKSSDIKFTEDELKSLSDLRTTYQAVQNDFGTLRVRKILLEQQLGQLEKAEEEVEKKYVETQQFEQELVKTLTEKYGAGNLDPNTGVFTPISND
tara:strand:- start:438 stop:728 length:291 start_codon:yes stop_codon:yes gene_type:complete